MPPRSAFLLAAVLALAGCGAPSQTRSMAVAPGDALQLRGWLPAALKGRVGLAPVQGGAETDRWWGSRVSTAALQQALEDSLHAVDLRPATPEPAPRFELRAELLALEQPPLPVAEVTVTAAVRYTLTDLASGRVLYLRRVASAGSAGLGEAVLSPSERLRLANERALRAGIGLMLRDLVRLEI
ncbi:MAG: hypothetical protein QM788_07550 [Roseateles sp.]|uniref:hypothetical protein n=1 Tax=Roseateles sp. TaxID=1971397 RepID=UPI0039EC9AA1